MSLVATAIRFATVRALRDATLAEDRVWDSAIDPIDQTIQAEARPIITVSTDDSEGEIEGRDLLGANPMLALTIEMAVAQKVTIDVGDGEPATEIVVPHTDAGLELTINLMARQVTRALLVGNEWSDLWRLFIGGIDKMTTRRGASAEKGVRFAARQIVLHVVPLAEPSFGPIEPGGPWGKLLALMRADSELAHLADLIQTEIETPYLPSWRRAAVDLGLRDLGSLSIGIGPAVGQPAADEPTPPLSAASVTFPGGEWVGSEERINDALATPGGEE